MYWSNLCVRKEFFSIKNIYLIRHCKAEGQGENARLTETGMKQADELRDFLLPYKIDYIISSPYKRACQTITPLSKQLAIETVIDERLRERVLSNNNDPAWREMLKKTFSNLDLNFEGGESSREAMNRAISVLNDVLDSGYKNVAVVTHGNLLSLLLKYYDERIGFKEWEAMSNPDVFQLASIEGIVNIKRIWNSSTSS